MTPNHREFERLTDAAVAYCEEQLSAMADPTQLDTTPWDGSATHAVAYFEALIERLQGDRDQQGGEDQSQQNQQVGQQGQLGHQQHQQHQHESFLPPHVQQQHASSPRVQQTEGAQHGDSSAGLKAQEIAQAQRVHALSTALGGVTILMKVQWRCNTVVSCFAALPVSVTSDLVTIQNLTWAVLHTPPHSSY